MAPKDRDVHVSKHTPVRGVEIAKADLTPVDMPVIKDDGLESQEQGIDRRVKETKNTALTTLDRVDTLRLEVRQDIGAVNTKIDNVIAVVGDLRVSVGEQTTQNKMIISMLDQQNKTRDREEQVVTHLKITEADIEKKQKSAEIDIETTRATTQLEDDAAVKAAKREVRKAIALKAVAVIGTLWTTFSIAYLSHCGG